MRFKLNKHERVIVIVGECVRVCIYVSVVCVCAYACEYFKWRKPRGKCEKVAFLFSHFDVRVRVRVVVCMNDRVNEREKENEMEMR